MSPVSVLVRSMPATRSLPLLDVDGLEAFLVLADMFDDLLLRLVTLGSISCRGGGIVPPLG